MWAARLDCGHRAEGERGLPPRRGQWISCQASGCRGQHEVLDGVAMTALFSITQLA